MARHVLKAREFRFTRLFTCWQMEILLRILLEEYPSINKKDILACLDYAASLAEEHVTPIESL